MVILLRSRILRPLVDRRTWNQTIHLLVDLPLGIAWFAITVTLLTAATSLSFLIVGIPLLAAAVHTGRWIGRRERARARSLLNIETAEPPALTKRSTAQSALRTVISDRHGWKGLLYGTLLLPWGIIASVVTIVTWCLSAALTTFALSGWVIPRTTSGSPYRFTDDYILTGWGRFGYTVGLTALGIVFLAAAPRIVTGLAAVDRLLITRLLDAAPLTASSFNEDARAVDFEHATANAGAALGGRQ